MIFAEVCFFYMITNGFLSFSLHLKEEAGEYLEIHTLEEIIRKYSQFINFNIYLWKSKTVKEEVADDDGKTTCHSHLFFSTSFSFPLQLTTRKQMKPTKKSMMMQLSKMIKKKKRKPKPKQSTKQSGIGN